MNEFCFDEFCFVLMNFILMNFVCCLVGFLGLFEYISILGIIV